MRSPTSIATLQRVVWSSVALSRRYGPRHFSRDIEEWIIRDFFQDRRDGVFLDVGANHYERDSNTYFLETELGWSGIAIDALPEFAEGYRKNRPRTRFLAMFASDVAGASVQFFGPANGNYLVASSDRGFTASESGLERSAPGANDDAQRRTGSGRSLAITFSRWTSSSRSRRLYRDSTLIGSARHWPVSKRMRPCGS